MQSNIRLISLKPTPFFVSQTDGMRQLCRLTLENPGEAREIVLSIRLGAWEANHPLGKVTPGTSVHDIYFPDILHPQEASLQAWEEDVLQDTLSAEWQPQKKWEVHMVHYSHHDLGYTDIPSRVIAEHVSFLDDVLRFCEETERWPEEARFRWLVEQGYSLVEFCENRPPETVERLMRFARDGQVEVTALYGNQTLELSSHEEMVRLLYPTFQLKQKYGIEIVSATHNDIPGFPWGLASILSAAGVKYFCTGVPSWYFGRGDSRVHPLWDETAVLSMEKPGAFWWQGPDGGRVLLWYNLHGMEWYPTSYAHAFAEIPGMLSRLDEVGYAYDQVLYTIRGGNRDNAPPTLRSAYLAREWNERWAYPRLVTSTHRRFLDGFERKYGASLKTLRGDVPGTDYSVAAACTPKETSTNRRTHDWLMAGEKLATLAALKGAPASGYAYPRPMIDQAYRNVFYYDEHCWGMWQSGGPALDADWSEKSAYAYRGAGLAHDILLKAANRLADEIDYPEEGYYLTVFNSLSWECSTVVRAPLRTLAAIGNPMYWAPPAGPGEGAVLHSGSAIGRSLVNPPADLFDKPFELIDISTEARLPYQISRLDDPLAAQPWAAERLAMSKVDPAHRLELVFVAEELPPMGYRTYRVAPCEAWPTFSMPAEASPTGFVNNFYELRMDPQSGQVMSLLDRELNRPVLDPLAPHTLGQMIVRASDTGQESMVELTGCSLAEHGPVFSVLKRQGTALGCPQWSQEFIMYHSLKRLDVNTRLLRDNQPMLEVYFAFPFAVEEPRFRYEASGAVIRPTHDQLPGTNTDYYAMQHWADVSGPGCGVTWTPIDAHMAEFGGLWPGYVSGAHHGVTPPGYGHPFLQPGEMTKGHIYSLAMYNNFRTNFINVHPGDNLFRYSFTTHPGNWREARAWRAGWEAMNPPLPVWMKGPQVGALGPSHSFCQVDAPNVILLTLKQAEEGAGLIFRLAETAGEAAQVTLTLPSQAIFLAYETNPVEENQHMLPCTRNTITLDMKPFAIATVRVLLQGHV